MSSNQTAVYFLTWIFQKRIINIGTYCLFDLIIADSVFSLLKSNHLLVEHE